MASDESEGQPSRNVFKILTTDSPKINRPTELPDPALQNGRILPKKYHMRFKELNQWGKPLEEIDPYYEKGKTFIVVASNFRLFRYSTHHSLYLFNPLNTLRRFFTFILTHWIFAAVMKTVVVIHFFILAAWLSSVKVFPMDWSQIARIVFFIVYLAEFFLKWISMGFVFSPFTYLRSFWCWLDLTILLGNLIGYIELNEFNNAFFWCVETNVLLKAIFYSPGLHLAFDFCITCVGRLREMLLATFSIMSLFTIIAVQMYMGVLTQRCISIFDSKNYLNYTDEDYHHQWHEYTRNSSNWYAYEVTWPNAYLCGNGTGGGVCPSNYTCLEGFGSNPDWGYTSFDNYFWGMLTMLRLVTQDFGEMLIRQIFTTAGHFHASFFILVMFFGTFGLGTFAYGTIACTFLKLKERIDEDEKESLDRQNERWWIFSRLSSWDLPPGFNSFRRKIHCFLFHPFFEVCITCIVILDIILMCFDIEQPIFSQIFCWIYFFEFLVKLFAESPSDYFKHPEHILDSIIAAIFFFSMVLPFEFIRSLLVIRMLKLFPRWPKLNFVIQCLLNTLKSYWYFFTLLLIVMIVNAATGVRLFHEPGESRHPLGTPRWNYNDYEHSFLTVFRIATGEWIESLWDVLLNRDASAFFFYIPLSLTICLLTIICASAIVVETGETFSKIEFQENPLYSKFEEGLKRICVPITWLREKINPGGQTHNILEEVPIHRQSQQIEETSGDSPVPNAVGAADRDETIFDRIIKNRYYSAISILVILSSSITLTLDGVDHDDLLYRSETKASVTTVAPLATANIVKMIIFYSDIVFTLYFIVDVFIKFINCFLKKRVGGSWWGAIIGSWIFDSVLIVEMIFNLTMYSPYTCPLRGFFHLKCLRPFMLVSRVDRLTAVFNGLMVEINLLWRYILAGCFMLLAFDIQGVQLFKDKFERCVDPTDLGVVSSMRIANKSECIGKNLTWTNSLANFDNLLNGVRPIFFSLTNNGWLQPLHDATDIRGIFLQPEKDNSYGYAFYFVFLIIFGSFFLFFVLVGILIHYMRTDQYKGIFMTFDQFYDYKSNSRQFTTNTHPPEFESAAERKIPAPTWKVLKFFYDVVENPFFDKFIMCAIIFQLFTLSLDFYEFPGGASYHAYLNVLDYMHLAVVTIYVIEMICKLIGWRYHYFKCVYNRLDFFIAVLLLLGLILSDVVAKYFISPVAFSIVRIFRIFQFEPFQRRAVLSQKFLQAMKLIRSALLNLLMFLILNLFTFSLIFMATFKYVKTRASLNRLFNFESFWQSTSMLFQMATFGGWDGIYEALGDSTDCYPVNIDGFEPDCGDLLQASVLILSYLTISVTVVLNIYIVFILEIVKWFSENESSPPKNATEFSANGVEPSQADGNQLSLETGNPKVLTVSGFT